MMLLLRSFILIFLLFFSNIILASDALKVTFINPSHPASPFWSSVTEFMKAAADDLGIKLKVVYSSKSSDINRLNYLENFKNEAHSLDKPDFILTHFRQGSAKRILDIAEKAQVKTFIFNTEIPQNTDSDIGLPREKYKKWIGHMSPNDTFAGYALAENLLTNGKDKKLKTDNAKLNIIGISGNKHSVAALKRNAGLVEAVDKNNQNLHQIVFAKWQRPLAETMTKSLLNRYPNTSIIWAANDVIALGAIDAIKKTNKTPGKDIFIGGFDWNTEALEAIQAGTMQASYGGHFMEGGWAMVMLYDYANGKDFANTSTHIDSNLIKIDQTNIKYYMELFQDKDWSKIDFKKFSKVLYPENKTYSFSLEALFKQLQK